jgi:hypothetical protein
MKRLACSITVLVTLFTAVPAQAASPCKPDEIGILVCPYGKSELRAIHGTLSPGKHYAVAWATADGKTGKDYELFTGANYKARFADEDVPTFLVRLADGKAVTKLNGEHLGDQARYNHRTLRAIWSRSEAWMIAVNDGKWSTDEADAYRVTAGSTSAPLNLLKVCLNAEHRYFKHKTIKGGFDDYAQSMDVKSVDNEGMVAAICTMQVVKQDDAYSFAIRVKLAADAKGVSAGIRSVTLCKDDDKRAACTYSDVAD